MDERLDIQEFHRVLNYTSVADVKLELHTYLPSFHRFSPYASEVWQRKFVEALWAIDFVFVVTLN